MSPSALPKCLKAFLLQLSSLFTYVSLSHWYDLLVSWSVFLCADSYVINCFVSHLFDFAVGDHINICMYICATETRYYWSPAALVQSNQAIQRGGCTVQVTSPHHRILKKSWETLTKTNGQAAFAKLDLMVNENRPTQTVRGQGNWALRG